VKFRPDFEITRNIETYIQNVTILTEIPVLMLYRMLGNCYC